MIGFRGGVVFGRPSLTHNPDLPQSATPLKAAYTIDIF
jgi:hypothetical protein